MFVFGGLSGKDCGDCGGRFGIWRGGRRFLEGLKRILQLIDLLVLC